MKIAFASDIHLEFGPCKLVLPKGMSDQDIDVLILAGDISTRRSYPLDYDEDTAFYDLGADQANTMRFWRDVTNRFERIFYIPGNHDFYHGQYLETIEHIKKWMQCYGFDNRVTFDVKQYSIVDGVAFVGATLWSDFNKGDPRTLMSIKNMMADFHLIRYGDRDYFKFTPEDALYEHCRHRDFIKNAVAGAEKAVVFTHHGPTPLSIHEKYKNTDYHTTIMNGGYVSHLQDLLMDNPQIKYWIHGHTHEELDYVCGSTRVITNPRGYFESEVFSKTFKVKVLEI